MIIELSIYGFLFIYIVTTFSSNSHSKCFLLSLERRKLFSPLIRGENGFLLFSPLIRKKQAPKLVPKNEKSKVHRN